MLIKFLKQPFPYLPKKWHVVTLITVCVFVVLIIIAQFFNLKLLSFRTIVLFFCAYTLITALCASIINYVFPLLFKRFFDKKRWTMGKFIFYSFLHALMIGVANTLYSYFVMELLYSTDRPLLTNFYINLLLAFLIGIIPFAFGYFFIKNQQLQSDLRDKDTQNRKMMIRGGEDSFSVEKFVTLPGNTKDGLTLFPSELLFMESSGNYVYVHYVIKGQVIKKMLRVTLQQMEEFLGEYPFIVRCHRSFIVNIHQIDKIKGFKIRMNSTEQELPVSKSYKTTIQNRLKAAGVILEQDTSPDILTGCIRDI